MTEGAWSSDDSTDSRRRMETARLLSRARASLITQILARLRRSLAA